MDSKFKFKSIVSKQKQVPDFFKKGAIIFNENGRSPYSTILPTLSTSPSISISPTPSLTSTPSVTPSITPSVTVSVTPSITPSISISITPSVTPSISISSTPSVTPSVSISVTPSISISNTPSVSITPSVTPTLSISPTMSVTVTPTLTPSPSSTTFINPPLTIGSAIQVVSQSPFTGGGNSYQFFNANSNSYIDTPASSDWALGTGDFTIEWFQYTTTTTIPPYQRVFTVDDFPSMDIGVSNESGTFYYWANSSFRYSSAGAIVTNAWQHWAIVRQSQTTRIYRNGTLRGSSFSDTNNIANTTDPLTIGADNAHATNATFVGYITNFRWIKGLAVYTGDFTVPTSVLTATAGANPYGGSNTSAIGAGFTKLLLVP